MQVHLSSIQEPDRPHLQQKCLSERLVTIIIYLTVVGALLVYMAFLMIVDPLIRKQDSYIQPLHNEEDTEFDRHLEPSGTSPSGHLPRVNRLFCPGSLLAGGVGRMGPVGVQSPASDTRPFAPSHAQARANTVLERVEGAQQRWKRQVQEQRKTVFDRHKMLS
ncbi:proton-transporting V-type ATPase complex assembly regulator TMEM9 isoform X5 [Scyliorhinus torazame]|uniref:proton-transporting V-type ATPase complex assembly regulator TMEM9 isoform X5 n=1 Tax=Scyliorhinus torazame TaxID=75743 RepID=UPI003B5A24C2